MACEVSRRTDRDLLSKGTGTPIAYAQAQITRGKETLPKITISHVNQLNDLSLTLLKQAMQELGLTTVQVTNALTTARAIAAMEGSTKVECQHFAEALQYRYPLAAAFTRP